MEEKFYFKNNENLRLCGILTKPERDTKKCVVLCHGITGDKNECGAFSKLAKKLSKAGFAVFRFDFRGHGESEGSSVDLTVAGEKRDLESAIKFLNSLGYEKFGILAASFGGGAVSLFIAAHRDIVKTLVLWNAIIDYQSILEPELPWPKENFGKKAMEKLEKEGFIEIGESRFKVGKALFFELRKLHPWKELQKLNIPILFIHGDKDTYVPYKDSVKYSSLFKNAKLKIVHGAGHGLHSNKDLAEQADKETVKFFFENFPHP